MATENNEEIKETTQPVVDNNFSFKFPFTKLTEVTDDFKGYLVLPGIDKEVLQDYIVNFNQAVANNEFSDGNEQFFKKTVGEVFNFRGQFFTNPNNEYKDVITDSLTNEVVYGGNRIGINKIGIKPTANINNNVALFMNKVKNVTGLGNTIQIPLINSGIWLTINPPKNTDLVYIQHKLAEEAVIVGRETSKILGGTEGFVLTETVSDFIIDNLLVNTNLKLPAGEDIRQYIVNSDLQSIVIGTVSTMYPDGFTITRTCKNGFVILEDGSKKCNHTINGLINPKHMIFNNSKKITRDMLIHMAKKLPNSVTPAEVREYQSMNTTIQDIEKDITTDSGLITVTIGTPSIADYNHSCRLWYSEMTSQLDRLLEKADDMEDKNKKAFDLMRANFLSYFLPFIKSIKQVNSDDSTEVFYDSNEVVEDKRTIVNMDILNTLSVDGYLLKEIETLVKEYSRSNSLTVVAGPDYICPECNAKQSDNSSTHKDFENLIPIDALMVFFSLSAIRVKMA